MVKKGLKTVIMINKGENCFKNITKMVNIGQQWSTAVPTVKKKTGQKQSKRSKWSKQLKKKGTFCTFCTSVSSVSSVLSVLSELSLLSVLS